MIRVMTEKGLSGKFFYYYYPVHMAVIGLLAL